MFARVVASTVPRVMQEEPLMEDRELARALEGGVEAHRVLLAALGSLTDEQARSASLLPGWSVGHVLTHVARNADSHVRLFAAAERGEVVTQYEGGAAGRAADIEAGAARSASELVHDVRASAERLEAAWASASPACWAGSGITPLGAASISDLPMRRWREAVVHHTDLGLGYGIDAWPTHYVRADLMLLTMQWASRRPMGLTELPAEALAVSPAHRLAWLFGRLDLPGLAPANIFG